MTIAELLALLSTLPGDYKLVPTEGLLELLDGQVENNMIIDEDNKQVIFV